MITCGNIMDSILCNRLNSTWNYLLNIIENVRAEVQLTFQGTGRSLAH